MKSSKAFPLFITIFTPLIFFGVMRAGYQQNIGPVCDLNETFAGPNRPAYAHHCKCLGIRYFESPTATRPPRARRAATPPAALAKSADPGPIPTKPP